MYRASPARLPRLRVRYVEPRPRNSFQEIARTPGAIARTPPRYGAHGREVLREIGYTEAEIDDLARTDVLLEQRRR